MVFANQNFAPHTRNGLESEPNRARAIRRNGYKADPLADLISGYTSVTLEEINRVALLNRQEAKYVMTRANLAEILSQLGEGYAVLEIEGHLLHRYRTLYFDTEDFAMYRRHHAGGLNRYKVRAREYLESATAFLEVKHKTNKRRTQKIRRATPELVTHVGGEWDEFLQLACPYAPERLRPCLWSTYTRVTLMNQFLDERVTIDVDVTFAWQEKEVELEGIAIAEVKYGSRAARSPFMDALRARRIHRNGFSKYCMGMSWLYPRLKSNRFKSKQRLLIKLMQEARHELF